ncbi:conserved hypothetical protein [Ricinus communis]|uniref:Chromo domain-containing protein n=1 Tax=Ricinus communis TaxID=3988 RepID=B9ST56_RICCO|nr:conserved hypothetical protein [Ricinus communis]
MLSCASLMKIKYLCIQGEKDFPSAPATSLSLGHLDETFMPVMVAQADVPVDVLDVKMVKSRRGNSYRLSLVKWLGRPANESAWVADEMN